MLPFRLVSRGKNFLRRDRGAATIEVILWLPFFLGLFSLMVDLSMIFNNQSRIMRIIQDGNRNYSIRRLTTNAETETYVEGRIASISANANAVTTNAAGLITTTVTVPLADLDLLGIAHVFSSNWFITADQLDEGFSQP
ncbi:pilus assembly protein [Defluviimonas sp. WL0002]|uniref:Pilus assembly protein n=1 Tax=Albidovulum marisflavi TaxID=2984159 RepID=A0ABT2ZE07_9RHOB|nr:TadE/TadG family type IV pilus assembly protein [Defluviimonas sp. WL0002]MCV2869257.1 pilus assembly protein [Defluviimonas sp. WL0002]